VEGEGGGDASALVDLILAIVLVTVTAIVTTIRGHGFRRRHCVILNSDMCRAENMHVHLDFA
jgi:hypothetical protein